MKIDPLFPQAPATNCSLLEIGLFRVNLNPNIPINNFPVSKSAFLYRETRFRGKGARQD